MSEAEYDETMRNEKEYEVECARNERHRKRLEAVEDPYQDEGDYMTSDDLPD